MLSIKEIFIYDNVRVKYTQLLLKTLPHFSDIWFSLYIVFVSSASFKLLGLNSGTYAEAAIVR